MVEIRIDVYYDNASVAAPCTQLRNIIKLDGNDTFGLTNGKFKLAAFVGNAALFENYGLIVQAISLNGQPADMSLSSENESFTFSDVSRFSKVNESSFEVTAAAADLVDKRAGGMFVSDVGANDSDTLFEVSFDVQRTAGGKNIVSSEFGLLFGLKTGNESAVSNGVTGIIFCFDNSFAGVYSGNGTTKDRVGDGATDADNKLVATGGFFENTEAIRDSVIHVTAVGKADGQLTVSTNYTDVLGVVHNKTVVVENCDLNGQMAFFYTKTAAASVEETVYFSGIEYEITEAEEPSPWQIQPLEFEEPLRVNANPAVNDVYVEGKQPLSGAYSVQVHLLNNPTTTEDGMATRNFAEIGLGKVKFSIAGGEFTASVTTGSGTRSLTVYKADGVTAETANSHFMAIAAGGSGLPVWCVGNEYIFRFEIAEGGGRINVYYDAATASQPCTVLRNVILLEENGDYSLTNGIFRLSAVSDRPAFYDLLLFGISFGDAAADMQLSSANTDLVFSDTAHFCTAQQTSLSMQTGAEESKYQKYVSDFTVSDAEAEDGDIVLDVRFTVTRTAEPGATNGAFGLLLGMKSEEDTMNTNGVTGILFGSNNVYSGVYRGNGKNMNDNGLQWAVETKLGSSPAGTPVRKCLPMTWRISPHL